MTRKWSFIRGYAAIAALAAALAGCANKTQPPAAAPAAVDVKALNFGFPLGFSPEKMDRSADPRKDFRRYAAGRWMDAAKVPADSVRISSVDVQIKVVEAQQLALLEDAARTSVNAPKGTPEQQVGDFYAAGMDEKRLTELGVKPLQPELDRIAAIQDPKSLAEALGHLYLITDDQLLLCLQVGSDPKDRTRNMVFVGDGDLPMGTDNYLKPEMKPIRDAHVKQIADSLVIAGSTPEAAAAIAAKVLAIDTRVAAKKLSPVEMRDPAKRFVRMSYAELKKLLPNVDVDAMFRSLGMPTAGEVIAVQVNALRERNAMLEGTPAGRHQGLPELGVAAAFHRLPDTGVYRPQLGVRGRHDGQEDGSTVPKTVGGRHSTRKAGPSAGPGVRCQVLLEGDQAARRRSGTACARRVRERLEKNAWLEPKTRAEALGKLDAAKIDVGYPDKWIDYSKVDIRRDTISAMFTASMSSACAAVWPSWASRSSRTDSRSPLPPCPQT